MCSAVVGSCSVIEVEMTMGTLESALPGGVLEFK